MQLTGPLKPRPTVAARREALRVARRAARWLPVATVVESPALRPLRERWVGLRATDVTDLVQALDRTGVAHWLVGGWGIDALHGRQTRRHYDLDVLLDATHVLAPVGQTALEGALHGLGYRLLAREYYPGVAMPERWTWHDGGGRSLDLLPVALDRGVFGALGAAAFTQGRIANQVVPCASLELQWQLHQGYEPTPEARPDLDLLRAALAAAEGP